MGLIGSRIDDVSGIANRDHSSWWDPTQKAFNGFDGSTPGSVASQMNNMASGPLGALEGNDVTGALSGALRAAMGAASMGLMMVGTVANATTRNAFMHAAIARDAMNLLHIRSLRAESRATGIPIAKQQVEVCASNQLGYATNSLDAEIAFSVDERFTGGPRKGKTQNSSDFYEYTSPSFMKSQLSAGVWECKVSSTDSVEIPTSEDAAALAKKQYEATVEKNIRTHFDKTAPKKDDAKYQIVTVDKKGHESITFDEKAFNADVATHEKKCNKKIADAKNSVSFNAIELESGTYYVDAIVKNGKMSATARATLANGITSNDSLSVDMSFTPFRRSLGKDGAPVNEETFDALSEEFVAGLNSKQSEFYGSKFSVKTHYDAETSKGTLEVAMLQTQAPSFSKHIHSLNMESRDTLEYTPGRMEYDDLIMVAKNGVTKITIGHEVDDNWFDAKTQAHFDGSGPDAFDAGCNNGHGIDVFEQTVRYDPRYSNMSYAIGERREFQDGRIEQDIFVPKGQESNALNLVAQIREGKEAVQAPLYVSPTQQAIDKKHLEDFRAKLPELVEAEVKEAVAGWLVDNPKPTEPVKTVPDREAIFDKAVNDPEIVSQLNARYKALCNADGDEVNKYSRYMDEEFDESKLDWLKEHGFEDAPNADELWEEHTVAYYMADTYFCEEAMRMADIEYQGTVEQYKVELEDWEAKQKAFVTETRLDITESYEHDFDVQSGGRYSRFKAAREQKDYEDATTAPPGTVDVLNEYAPVFVDFDPDSITYEDMTQDELGDYFDKAHTDAVNNTSTVKNSKDAIKDHKAAKDIDLGKAEVPSGLASNVGDNNPLGNTGNITPPSGIGGDM